MRTVKQVAELSGVSIRTLQYYDEIGVFKPTVVTASGYRLYDDEALKTLQQVLFFKELDFPLKDIKEIMRNPRFDKIEAFKKQKELIRVKRDRLDGLLNLLEKLEKGESCMSFKEFDMSEYLQVLEQFKAENAEDIIKHWGSVEEYDKFKDNIKDNEAEVARLAIKQYGSIEKYTEAMKENMRHFSENIERLQSVTTKNNYLERNKALNAQLVADITKDVTSKEIQDIVQEIIMMIGEVNSNLNMGENYWNMVIDGYLHNTTLIDTTDRIYGAGASEFMGKAFQYYLNSYTSYQ
jgi:DNA-binding transcriptional MerR regulator